MGYVIIEESLFRKLMSRYSIDDTEIRYVFSESEYWMNGNEVCDLLHISKALLNSLRREKIFFHCKIKEIYHYKRADVYKFKVQMAKELVESGSILGNCTVINDEQDLLSK